MEQADNWQRFELLVMPQVDAAYNLARWLTHNDHDAQDVVQEALVRTTRSMGGFRGEDARTWLLQIVLHTCHSWLEKHRPAEGMFVHHADDALDQIAEPAMDDAYSVALRKADRLRIDQAIAGLPIIYREVLILRELEDLSYSDIACIVDIPAGAVMSRLARARALMREALQAQGASRLPGPLPEDPGGPMRERAERLAHAGVLTP